MMKDNEETISLMANSFSLEIGAEIQAVKNTLLVMKEWTQKVLDETI